MRYATLLALALLAATGCDREHREFQTSPPSTTREPLIQLTDLEAGPPQRGVNFAGVYEDNAWAIGEGLRYYAWFNCVGCHAHGGGAIGPPLMDEEWIYGSEPENIYQSIVQGRPNGMPSFGGRIPSQQVWQLVAYVRSLSGLTRYDARPGRADDMRTIRPRTLVEDPPNPKQSIANPP